MTQHRSAVLGTIAISFYGTVRTSTLIVNGWGECE